MAVSTILLVVSFLAASLCAMLGLGLDLWSHRAAGLAPASTSRDAVLATFTGLQGVYVATLAAETALLARWVSSERRPDGAE